MHSLLGRNIHWITLLALLSIQAAMFHRFAKREIVWAYPRHCDQAVYLEQAYAVHLRVVDKGLWQGLAYGSGFREAVPSPNGALMHLQGAMLFCVGGPSRMTALALLFLYFAAFEAMLFGTLYAVTHRWSVAWIGVGLLLAARTTFQDTGGIMDFRPDLAAMCLFGIFICCVMRSNLFQLPGWSALAGIAAAFTMAFRFLTLAYFIPIFALTLAMLVFCWARSRWRAESTAFWNRRLRNLLMAGIVGSILIGPVLFHHKNSISNYYLRLHASGQERYERAAMFHVTELGASLKFYPQSLYLHHLGLIWLGIAGAVFVVSALTPVARRAPAVSNGIDRRLAIAFSLFALFVPLALLTWDVDKNPSVGDIMVPAALWLVILLARFPLTPGPERFAPRLRLVFPIAIVLGGIAVQVFSCLQHSDLSRHRPQAMSILAMYDAIGASAEQHGWTDPIVADDAFSEYQFAPAIDVTIYERHGRLMHSHEAMAKELLGRSHDELLKAVESADYVLLSEPHFKRDVQDSFDQSTRAAHAKLLDYCHAHLRQLFVCPTPERTVTVFIRERRGP